MSRSSRSTSTSLALRLASFATRGAAALALGCALVLNPAPAGAAVLTSDVILGQSASARGIDASELPDISAPHAMVLGQDGSVYFERDTTSAIKIASVTKVMTALVALETCSLSDTVHVDHAAATVGEASLGLLEGDTLTMGDALTGMMVMSGNDAAYAIAVTAGAKIDPASSDPYQTFIAAMNNKAAELGCSDTLFENPHGLDFGSWAGNMHSTTSDITRIFAAAMANEQFRAIDNSNATSIPVTSADGTPRTVQLVVRNAIHGQQGNIGGKTGTTYEAGNCFVGAFSREAGGEVYVAVFGAETTEQRFADTLALATWYYDHIATVPLANTPATLGDTPVIAEVACTAWSDRTAGVTLADVSQTVQVFSLGGSLSQQLERDALEGAVEAGDNAGSLELVQGDTVVATADLVAAESVERPGPFEWLMIEFDRLVRRITGEPLTAETVLVNEVPDPLALDAWGAA